MVPREPNQRSVYDITTQDIEIISSISTYVKISDFNLGLIVAVVIFQS